MPSSNPHEHNPRHEEPDFTPTYEKPKPYWRRAHMDWRAWVAVTFLFAAIAIYVVTVDLSIVPRLHR
jgi:hypothetical protein